VEKPRSTFGMDLHVDLRGPLRARALEAALRDAIASGRLTAGTRLPSSRSLAADLGLARNTVVDAYDQLVAEGWLSARHGSGTAVADHRPGAPPVRDLPAVAPRWARSYAFDLRPGGPDLSSFPRSAWLSASRRALSRAPDAALGYGDPRGSPELRAALAEYLGRARGVRTDPSRLVVCSGFTQAFGLLCRALHGSGARTVAVECYGLPELRQIVAGSGLRQATVPVDDQGADLRAARRADAALLTPAHQFPLGTVLSPTRRHDALDWARRHDALIVEDDYDGEFRYDREPLGALQGLDPDRVVYAGTASKTFAPGLRLAWLVLPDRLVEPVMEEKTLADRQTGILDQLTLAELLASGGYDRHVRRQRSAYRRRRDRLVRAVGEVEGISAGLHALVPLPDGSSEDRAVAVAATRGLALEGLDGYRARSVEGRPALVVGYATPPDHAYRGALEILAEVLDHLGCEPATAPSMTRRAGSSLTAS
jgi:GntR family transcriptional regulator/MocR family aminotransferase